MDNIEPWALAERMAIRAKEAGAWKDEASEDVKFGSPLHIRLNNSSIVPANFVGLPSQALQNLVE